MLENKTVNIENVELLKFFYPDYKIREEVSFRDRENRVIYIGGMRRGLLEYLKDNTVSYISTVGRVDIDLMIRENLIKFVFSKYGKSPSDNTVQSVEFLDDNEFIYTIKVFWLTGKWVYKEDDVSIYDLFKSTVRSVNDMLNLYFKLLDVYPFYVVEASFLTFIQRAKGLENQEVSASYYKLLKRFNSKSKDKVKKSVIKYAQNRSENEELEFINLLLSLR